MLFSRTLVRRILGRGIPWATRRASSTSPSTASSSPTAVDVSSVGPADVEVFPLEDVPSTASFERRLAWVENMDTVEARKLGLIELHPEIFVAHPKIHLIHDNVMWQMKYQVVNYESARTRAEMPGGGRKPWPQKGQGKARHGSIRSPLWKGGGIAHGPRGPRTYFYMLSGQQRAAGLCATLSVKLAQGDLHVVDSLEGLASGSGEQLEQLVAARSWQHSVLFVDRDDVFSENAVRATDAVPHFNLMPVYGLNVFSMLKHDTLVLTVPAMNRLQQRLLAFMRKPSTHVPSLKDPSFFI